MYLHDITKPNKQNTAAKLITYNNKPVAATRPKSQTALRTKPTCIYIYCIVWFYYTAAQTRLTWSVATTTTRLGRRAEITSKNLPSVLHPPHHARTHTAHDFHV